MDFENEIRSAQREIFSNLLKQPKHTDIELVIGENEREYNLNGILLASISDSFESMIYGDEEEKGLDTQLVMDDIDTNAFECVLKFAYNNDPQITGSNILSVMHICKTYKIQSLLAICEKYFSILIDSSNFCRVFNDVVESKSDTLIVKCMQFLENNGKNIIRILQSEEFYQLSVDTMQLFLQSDYLNIKEEKLWQFVVKWSEYQSKKHNTKVYTDIDDEKHRCKM